MARRRRERMSEGGTAKITGIPQRTISYRAEKALEKLRKIIGVKKS